MNATEPATIDVGCGRTLAYSVQGDPDGQPVVWFDGTPGSRLTDVLDATLRREFGLQVLTFDRPGYGRSGPMPGRTVADVAHDVAGLVEHLGWRTWLAVGYSGGGPHALACAAAMPDRVAGVVAIATVGPPHELPDWESDAPPSDVATFRAIATDRAAFDEQMRRTVDAVAPDPVAAMIAAFGSGGTAADADWLSDPGHRRMFDVSLSEALAPGHFGWRDDEVALHEPWGFSLQDIRRPTLFLHGAEDPIAPVAHARQMVDLVPGASMIEVPDVGHLAILSYVERLESFITEHSRTTSPENH